MKIDLIITNLGDGGAQRVVSSLANYLCERENRVRIITFKDGDKFKLHENVERIRLHKKLSILDSNLFRAAVHLIRFYKKRDNRPDVISSHINTMGYATIPVSYIYNIKLVVSEHNNHLAKNITAKEWFLWNILYKIPDAVTILTSFDQPYFRNKNKKVIVMANPLSFNPNLGLSERNNKTIVVAGSLDRYHHKGLDNLMDIVAGVSKKHDDWRFMIIGEGEKGLQFLTKKAEQLGILDNIIFAGYRRDIQNIMQTCEIFMLCSRYEGLPMVLMEASSQGIACIAYNCISGPSEIIQDGITGLLVKDQNITEMIKKTNLLIEDKLLRTNLAKNAIRYVEKFSIEKIGSNWAELFAELQGTNN